MESTYRNPEGLILQPPWSLQEEIDRMKEEGNDLDLEIEETTPKCARTRAVINLMNESGARVIYGRWLVEGGPQVILFDLQYSESRLQEWRHDVWERTRIGISPLDREINERFWS